MKFIVGCCLLLACSAPAFAATPVDSKHVAKEFEAPAPDENSVSVSQAEAEAKKVFCGIAGKSCDTDDLKSKCLANEDRKKQLTGFKCDVFLPGAAENASLDALRVNFSKHLAYDSSKRKKPPTEMNPKWESEAPTKASKKVSQ